MGIDIGYLVMDRFILPNHEGMAGDKCLSARADLQVMLRHAALMIRNATPTGPDAETEDALPSLAKSHEPFDKGSAPPLLVYINTLNEMIAKAGLQLLFKWSN